jgi:hypothetical protein
MTNPLYTVEQLPTTSAAAIREFDDRYIAALGAAAPSGWVDKLGALVPTSAPMVTFPVSQLRTRYLRTQGEGRAKTLGEKSFDIKSEEFDDGYEARLMDIFQQVFAYRNWQQAPGRLVLAEEQFRHDQIALLLEAGASTACVDGENFFDTDHPANLFDDSAGTWGNYQATPADVVSVSTLQTEVTSMMAVKDENGRKLGVVPDTILVPTEKAEPLKNLLKKEMIAIEGGSGSESNPYMNGFNVIPIKELTDVNDWFLVDSKLAAAGLAPWISLRQTVPTSLALRVFDEASDFFKKTGRLRIESHIWYGFALGLPHAIRLVKGA